MASRIFRTGLLVRDTLFSSAPIRRLLHDRRVVLVDGGARGALPPPLDRIDPAHRWVVRFEPDESAEVDEGPGERSVRHALWSHAGRVECNLTMLRSCS